MTRSPQWKPRPRTDFIVWNKSSFNAELTKDLIIDESIDLSIYQSVIYIIHNNWDSYYAQGATRPMIDFEFCLNTGDSKPVCCRQLVYCIHERKIMNTYSDFGRE